ncbi:hypothetical protein UlMin_040069 [Ulmus minor]
MSTNIYSSKELSSELAPLEAILFDVDGTLCDLDPLHYYAFCEMLQEEFGVINDDIAGKHNDDIALSLFPDDYQRGLKFVDDKEAMFRQLALEQLKPISGLYKLKKWIEDRGLKRAAFTNAPRPNNFFFDFLIIGGECEHAKPHLEPYLKALELLKASKDHTFIFEDFISEIKVGMPVVGLSTRNLEHLLMEAKPIFLIKDYEDSKLWAELEELDKKPGTFS